MPSVRPINPPRPLPWWSQAWRIALAAILGCCFWFVTMLGLTNEFTRPASPEWLPFADVAVGLGCLVLLPYRRRFPRSIAVLLGLAGALSSFSAGSWLIAAVSLGTKRRFIDIPLIMATAYLGSIGYELIAPTNDPTAPWVNLVILALFALLISMSGWYIGARRDLVASLEARAETAEREQAARVSQARANERTAIAREMHDVLAHRISLIAMHAGALTYRTDLTPEQSADTAQVIEANAHLALTDLRDVLGVLRSSGGPGSGDDGDGSEVAQRRPQPDWSDLPALIAEARAAGTDIVITDELTVAPPTTVSRHAYRIVQEALTNVRKHAPNCVARVGVSGEPGADLVIEIENPLPRGTASGLPGAGLGLAGLAERAQLAGGTLSFGRTDLAAFRVRATLPWPAVPNAPARREHAPEPTLASESTR